MEHLLSPASAEGVEIPYVGTQVFELDISTPDDTLFIFKSYLERNGWTRHAASGDVILQGKSYEQITDCLQTWLYFGCLVSVMRRVGIPARTYDFVTHSNTPGLEKPVVNTSRLHGCIAEWARLEGFANGPVVSNFQSPKYLRGENIKEMLHYTYAYLDQFAKAGRSMPAPHRKRMEMIQLSIMALGEGLCSALVAIYGYEARGMPNWGPSPILEARLRNNGWCVSDSPFFPSSAQQSNISTAYYFGGCVCPRPRGDHSNCSVAICHEYLKVINPGTYTQKHVSEECSCTLVEAPEGTHDIVRRGAIPILRWDGQTLAVSEVGPLSTYVAMSHV